METFEAEHIVKHVHGLIFVTALGRDDRASIQGEWREKLIVDFRGLKDKCGALGLFVSERKIRDALEILEGPPRQHETGMMSRAANDISSTIALEISQRLFFYVPPERAKYYEPTTPIFGTDVQTKFPKISYELDEATKCMTFRRSTAAVFHFMRLLEIAVTAIAACLSIPPPTKGGDRNWGSILGKIKKEIDRRNTATPPAWNVPDDRQFFAEVYASLDAVRVAWRNTTMHVENKYSDEEAEHIFVAARGFMRKVASRMDEQGAPLA